MKNCYKLLYDEHHETLIISTYTEEDKKNNTESHKSLFVALLKASAIIDEFPNINHIIVSDRHEADKQIV